MKQGNLHKIVFILFALLLAASCDKEQFTGTPAEGEPQQIRFDIAVADAIPSGASTRVSTSTDGQYTCSFSAGDRVGLYIVKGDAGLQSSGNWVDNALMTYDGTKWNYQLPDGREYFPSDGSKLSFYAYYPYDAQLANPLNMSITVPSDQSTGTALASAYLMTAGKTGVSRSHNPVPLVFSNKLALVKVNLKNGTQPKDIAPRPADVVTLKGRQLMTTLNLATDAVGSTSGAATDVRMHYNTADKCWYALVPSQGVAAGSGLLTFEWTAITTLNHTTKKMYTLQAGQVQPLDITIDVNMTPDPNHVYAVGDAYPYVGFYDKKGVVVEVSNGGKSGKIIGLKRKSGLPWSTERVFLNANNKQNGRVNMETVRQHDNAFTEYPAFKWVHELNPPNTTYADDSKGIWYLPAGYELKSTMYADENQEKIGRTLEAFGLEIAFSQDFGWCSSEQAMSPQYRAHRFSLKNGLVSYDTKTNTESYGGVLYAWPILAF